MKNDGLPSRVRFFTLFLDLPGPGFDGFSHWVGLADKCLAPMKLALNPLF